MQSAAAGQLIEAIAAFSSAPVSVFEGSDASAAEVAVIGVDVGVVVVGVVDVGVVMVGVVLVGVVDVGVVLVGVVDVAVVLVGLDEPTWLSAADLLA
jgi:hypothetical protein